MEPTFPPTFSNGACTCIRGLLKVNEADRLGNGPGGAKDIMNSEFFSVYDFEQIYRKEVVPPFRPNVKNEIDTTYISDSYLIETAKDSFANTSAPAAVDQFEEFSYEGDV